jgi:hypothetical protein
MTENCRAALSQDVYRMKAGSQVFQPRFTSHGYQYIEITGIEKALPLDAVEGVVISSLRELTADYKTSSDKVNRLWSNLVWSNVDNFLTIPTDCPQRNERMGWSATSMFLAHCDVHLKCRPVFDAEHVRDARRASSVGAVRGRRAGWGRLWRNPLGQRWNRGSLGDVSSNTTTGRCWNITIPPWRPASITWRVRSTRRRD